jgi:uncharacterized protein YicC (UPF0701 family)
MPTRDYLDEELDRLRSEVEQLRGRVQKHLPPEQG